MFDCHLCGATALNNIKAPDVLAYLGSLIGGASALIAILVAIKQFNADKKPIIVPRNKRFFFYKRFCGRTAFLDNPDLEDDLNVDIEAPIIIELDNVTDNSGLCYSMTIDYKEGEYYRAICDLIGGAPEGLDSSFEASEYANQGVFNAKSTKRLLMPTDIEFTIKGVCYKLHEPKIGASELSQRYNYFIRKSYKIADMIINTQDIMGKTVVEKFGIELSLRRLSFNKADYEISLSFIQEE